jgi:uncharacterized Zn finger protein
MKHIYYECDLCGKKDHEMYHWKAGDVPFDFCALCGEMFSEGATKLMAEIKEKNKVEK